MTLPAEASLALDHVVFPVGRAGCVKDMQVAIPDLGERLEGFLAEQVPDPANAGIFDGVEIRERPDFSRSRSPRGTARAGWLRECHWSPRPSGNFQVLISSPVATSHNEASRPAENANCRPSGLNASAALSVKKPGVTSRT